ncbi:LytTR family DNA-binding domain-containing protein [Virgibacillus sp. W0430]|uniref:LytTR family DNA-binding domain-containing protein n=1 Tax=Virgibacillus sp. W0430 TaxID=3391580 RepID=UPI003F48344A
MKIEKIPTLINSFYNLFPGEKSIAVSDSTSFIYFKPSRSIDLNICINDPIKKEPVTYQAIQTQKKVAAQIDDSSFSTPYYGVSVPIIENDHLKGAMTAFFPQELNDLTPPFLTVKTTDKWLPIHLKHIIYMEAQNRKTHILSMVGKGTHRNNLSELEFVLPKDMFIRCHRSYIVNLHQIKEIHPDSHSTFSLVMKDDSRVPVSQSYAKNFRKRFGF